MLGVPQLIPRMITEIRKDMGYGETWDTEKLGIRKYMGYGGCGG